MGTVWRVCGHFSGSLATFLNLDPKSSQEMLVNGASLYEVQHLLGHSQAKTTSRYAHLGDDTLRKVSDNITNMISNAIA